MTEKAKELGNETIYDTYDNKREVFMNGLTKREYFAGLAMQGYVCGFDRCHSSPYKSIAIEAVKCADALLEELVKEVKDEKN